MIAEINPAIAPAERRVKLSNYGAASPQIALSEAPQLKGDCAEYYIRVGLLWLESLARISTSYWTES
jgi:hypothetical protein